MLRVDLLRGDAHMGVSQREKVGYVPFIMEHLPPAGWSDLATRQDVAHQGLHLRSELRAEMAQLRTELCGEIAKVRDELRTEMHEGFRSQLRWMIGTFLTLFIGSTTLISTFLLTVK